MKFSIAAFLLTLVGACSTGVPDGLDPTKAGGGTQAGNPMQMALYFKDPTAAQLPRKGLGASASPSFSASLCVETAILTTDRGVDTLFYERKASEAAANLRGTYTKLGNGEALPGHYRSMRLNLNIGCLNLVSSLSVTNNYGTFSLREPLTLHFEKDFQIVDENSIVLENEDLVRALRTLRQPDFSFASEMVGSVFAVNFAQFDGMSNSSGAMKGSTPPP